MRPIGLAWVIFAAAGLAGCANMADFQKADSDTKKGGAIDKAKQAELAKQQAEAKVKTDKEDQLVQSTREAERMDKRIAATQQEIAGQDAALADALEKKKITQAQYKALKQQQDSIKGDAASLHFKDASDRSAKRADPKAEAEKEKQLETLKKRRADLETALAMAMKN